MVERGVRFINIYHEGWDAHSDVAGNLKTNCGATDKASAALVVGSQAARAARRHARDLGRRVRPHADGRNQPRARPQPRPRSSPAGLHDLDGRRRHQAGRDATARPTTSASTSSRTRSTFTTCRRRSCTCLGFDHEKLTFRHAGRDFRLTDVFGKVIPEVLA